MPSTKHGTAQGKTPSSSNTPSPLHPRNRHQGRYDFKLLVSGTPELARFVFTNQHGIQSINFADPLAVKVLNRALLKTFYHIEHWDIPDNYLCPPIPGRADYVHYLADLLADTNKGTIPKGPSIRVLDIGIGANAIYPLLGHAEYGWQFLGSDIDATALASARTIIHANKDLANAIKLRQQKSPKRIFQGVLSANDRFDLTLCNPPFHMSRDEAISGNQRKWRGLGKATAQQNATVLNFGGQSNELWCEGGEAHFIRRMVEESAGLSHQVLWFSTLVSKATNVPGILHVLRKAKALNIKTIEMAQGQKQSRFLAWTFLSTAEQAAWRNERWK